MFTVSVSLENNGEYLKGKCAMSDFSKQTAEFISCVVRNIPARLTSKQMQHWVENPNDLQVILEGLALVVCVTTDELQDSTLIRIDRTKKPVYPDWFKELVHPELEHTGPTEYDPTRIELYLHQKQKDEVITGHDLLKHFEETDTLKDCANLQDALAIQKLGIKMFRKIFGKNYVFCWKSVVRGRDGNLRVPYVNGAGGKVFLNWGWLDAKWHSYNPAVCLSN